MKEKLEKIEQEAAKAIEDVPDLAESKNLKAKYLGRKGVLTLLLREISSLPSEERPEAGRLANEVKKRLTKLFDQAVEPFRVSRRCDNYRPFPGELEA